MYTQSNISHGERVEQRKNAVTKRSFPPPKKIFAASEKLINLTISMSKLLPVLGGHRAERFTCYRVHLLLIRIPFEVTLSDKNDYHQLAINISQSDDFQHPFIPPKRGIGTPEQKNRS